jgi:hypothetical protein
MFSALDPDVVYLMLSECDFKGEKSLVWLFESYKKTSSYSVPQWMPM